MGPEPEGWPITSLAITFCTEEQFNAGRPGREATPAKHGVMRVPSGGRLESGAEVRMMIQCWSSQLFPGKVQAPVNVLPAFRLIVSPQADELSAVCKPAASATDQVLPAAGVFASAL